MILPTLFRKILFRKIIKMTTTQAILNDTVSFVDVRNDEELESDGKLDGAHHYPVHTVPDHVEEIRALSRPIVVFCKSGGRASRIIEFLQSQGMDDLYNGGGITDVKAVLNANSNS